MNFAKFPQKIELPDKKGFERTDKREERVDSHLPSQTPFINWAWCPWCGVFPLASLGWLPGCAPSQLLHTCSLDEYEKLEKSPCFHSNDKNLQCYQHFSPAKSKTQQLLEGKLSLSQLKPGHSSTSLGSLFQSLTPLSVKKGLKGQIYAFFSWNMQPLPTSLLRNACWNSGAQ